MSDQANDGANAPATPQGSETSAGNPTENLALTAAPAIPAIVPELAEHPTGAYLSLSDAATSQDGDRTITINMASAQPIAGFQFRLSGGVPIACEGGRAAEMAFTVATNEETGIVLGHYNASTTVPIGPGDGVLTQLTFRPDPSATEVCLTAPVIGDPQGEAVEAVLGGCLPLD